MIIQILVYIKPKYVVVVSFEYLSDDPNLSPRQWQVHIQQTENGTILVCLREMLYSTDHN